MNEFGMTVLRSAVQVTLVALPASALVLWAARRNAAATVAVATAALAVLALVTATAFCPLPAWWSWQPAAASAAVMADAATGPHSEMDTPAPAGIAFDLDWLAGLRRLPSLMPHPIPSTEVQPERTGWAALAVVFLVGTVVGFGHLLLGLWTVARCRRRSRPITDACVLALADELRIALGGRPLVELRESDEVGTAATIGWRRPVVLLAPDWPVWTEAERRGVLAHELSHARRQDYLTGLFARCCVALHFYHPLVRFLAGRLRLHQELAADAAAARCAGGRGPYLTALARMALRQDAGVRIGPALPFLSGRGTLLRRIAMLRVTDDGHRPLSGAGRAVMAALLVAIGVGVTALRGPAQTPPGQAANDLPPFDLSYLPPDAIGVACVRPAALFSQPGMKPVAEQWGKLITQAFVDLGVPEGVQMPLDAIEQVVGPLVLRKHDKPSPDGHTHSLLMSLSMVRTNRDYDWPTLIRTLGDPSHFKDLGDGVYQTRWTGFPADQTVKVVDKRTLVFTWDAKRPTRATAESIAAQFGPAWRNAQRATVAVALDNRDRRWTQSLEGKPEMATLAMLGHPTHLVIEGPAGPTVGVNCSLAYAEAASAEKATAQVQVLAQAGDLALAMYHPVSTDEVFFGRLTGELLAGRKVSRDGKFVRAEFRSKTSVADALKAFVDAAKPAAVVGPEELGK